MGTDLKTAFLLTAGIGSRLAPHTHKKPKPSLPFLGLPLMSYGFYLLQKAAFKDYLFNLHHLPELMKNCAEGHASMMDHYEFMDETKALLGSGGGIWNARQYLKEKDFFLIANGDEVFIPQNDKVISNLTEHFKNTGALCTLLTCDHPDLVTKLKPVWFDEKGNLIGFAGNSSRASSPNAKAQHYTGYKAFSPRIFDYLPEGESHIFYEVLIGAKDKGETINCFKIDSCHWYETGNFNGFMEASQKVLSSDIDYLIKVHQFYNQDMELLKLGDHLLWKEKQLNLPNDFSWTGTVSLSPGVSIGQNVHLENVSVDKGSIIPDQTNLKDQFIFAD
ncbi:MAG: NDP-sugar synthase [Bdellovibrionales bacterium]|nr:NDP-sugar synthase [Bdellovibrionales bacterium]NQZ19537.1 NDP-sugar synthase [Bdellovibrionales bacterium]